MAWGDLFRWLWFWRKKPEPELVVVPEPVIPKPPRKTKKAREEDTGGSYYFREDILDKLDGYFHYLRRFKHADPDAYALFGKIGAAVLPNKAGFFRKELDTGTLPPTWNAGARPGFFAGFAGDWLDADATISMRFSYFQKFHKVPPYTEQIQSDSTVYKCVYYHDDRHPHAKKWVRRMLKKSGYATEFWLEVTADNRLRLLKERYYESIKIVHHKPHHDVSWRPGACRLRYPNSLTGWYKDLKDRKEAPGTVEEFALRLFTFVAHEHELANSGTQVAVSKGDLKAVFSIAIERTPYFFKDRDLVVNHNGRRRRIFHIVRPHERLIGNRTIMINMHFRGARIFDWNGYSINITVPGLHHFALPQFTVGAVEDEPGIPVEKLGEDLHAAFNRQEKLPMKQWIREGQSTSIAKIRRSA